MSHFGRALEERARSRTSRRSAPSKPSPVRRGHCHDAMRTKSPFSNKAFVVCDVTVNGMREVTERPVPVPVIVISRTLRWRKILWS